MDVAESMKAGGTHPALKHVYEIKALVQERDHQTKRMACAVKVFDSRCLVTSSDVDCKKPFIMDRYSRRHSYRLYSSVIECQTFERFSFLLLNEDITHRKQYIFDLPLKVRSPGGTVYVYGFGQSFTLDPEKRELDNNDLLGSPIVQEIVNVTGNEPNQAVVGVVGLSDKGKLCPCFITKKILDQLKESLEEDVKAKGQLEESLEDVNNGCNPKESEEKAAIKHSGENPGETSDVEDQQGGESSGQPGEATDGRTQPSGNTGPESEEKAAIKHSGSENPGETTDVEDQPRGESSGQPGEATDGRTQPSGNTGPDNQAFMEKIQRATEGGFECLRTACNVIKDKLPPLQMDEDLDFSSNGVDDYSQRLVPNTEAGVRALRTVGDGNCFYRAASVLAFGHQGNHEEMRLRTVVELATNSEFYLEQKDIGRRIAAQEQVFLQNSGEKDVKIDQTMLKTEFEIDVLDTAKLSTRASDWHLQALGTVLNRQVQSVFPECGAAVAREYYNALFLPRDFDRNKEPVKIMWTRSGGDITPFIPNHFVPLICVDKITCSSTDDLQDQGPATVKKEEDKRDGPEKEPESEEKATIENSEENPGETTDVEDQQRGESNGQPVQATDGRTQPSRNTGPGRYAQETGRAPLETLQQESRLKDTVSCNADIMDELALRLDKPHVFHNREVPLKKNWENLAEYFKLPLETKLQCQQNPQNSPAKNLFDFLVISLSFTVGRVIDCLNKIGSKHLSDMVEKLHLPENTELRYLYDKHLTVLRNIWLHLDVDGRGNWRDFGNEIKEISKDKLVRFANPKKCTEEVLDIIESRRPETTVQGIKTVLQELERGEVSGELISIPASASISELLDNVDAVEKIGTLLDDEIPGKKCWREFALKFGMTRVECDSIRPDGLPSPTKELFKHLAAVKPELTIKDFLAAAVSIERDRVVVKILKKFYNASSVDKVLLAVQTEMDQRS